MMRGLALAAFLVPFTLAAAAPAPGDEPAHGTPPFARVGKALETPEYADGQFRAFGWRQAVAFCGLRDASLPGAPFVGKDAAWWLTYDKSALYVAFIASLKPQGEQFAARATTDQDPAIFADDHIVVQAAADPRVGQAGCPYLRLAVNPNGAVWGARMEALPGQDEPVDTSRIAVGNHVGPHHVAGHWWIVRLRIPLDLLGVESLDGRTARLHLAWASPPLYLSWGGTKAGDWAGAPQVLFDPEPRASVRVNASYPALLSTAGRLHLDLQSWFQAGSKPKPATLRFSLRNEADGKVTWEKTWEETKASGEHSRTAFQGSVAGVRPDGNRLVLQAAALLDGDEQILLSNVLPYGPNRPDVGAALERWAELHAREIKAAAGFDYVYDPYSDRLDALVSTRLNPAAFAGEEGARAAAIAASDRLAVTVRDAGGTTLAASEGPVANGEGHALVQLPAPLPDGDYSVLLQLYRGDHLADALSLNLVRRRFPWEKSGIGRDKVVLPPWTPVTLDGRRLGVWGREYVIQDSGLPAAMVSQGKDVLGGPMRLTAIVDGKDIAARGSAPPAVRLVAGEKFPDGFERYELAAGTCPVAGKDFALETTPGYAAEVEARSALGPLDLTVSGRMDYDGLYRVTMTLHPRQTVRVDSMTLTAPLSADATLYRFSRALDMNCLGAVPAGDGVLEKSSNLPPHPALAGTFVPVAFAGQYDRGLFWMADTDRGWSVDDADDQVRLVREKGELALQFRFIARPTVLDAPRTIEFAFIATPSRPKAPAYRQAFWEGKRTHDTAGFRFYGDGVNGFQLYEPREYEALRRFIFESAGTAPHYAEPALAPPGHKSAYRLRNEAAKQGYPVTLYGCTWGANAGMREFATFGSAWTHTARTLETAVPHEEFRNWTNFGGTAKWTTRGQLTPVFALMDESFVDCWLWHMVRIGEHSGVNGCFFDCYESLPKALRGRVRTDITGVAYRREDGRLRPLACPLRYHERTRRYATALWMIGRPPSMLQSNNFDNTYGPTWYVEGPMYHRNVGETLIAQGVTPQKAAAYTASCSGMGFCRSDVRTALPGRLSPGEERCFAVLLAYGILHDLPWSGTPSWLSTTYRKLSAALVQDLAIGDPRVRHVRYWNPGGMIAVSDPRILAGGFVHPEGRCALVAVLNPAPESVAVTVTLDRSLLGRDPTSITDALTSAAAGDGAQARLELAAQDVRFLLVR